MRISQTQIVNGLCCMIGPLLAWNAYWIMRYWHAIELLWGDVLRCVAALH